MYIILPNILSLLYVVSRTTQYIYVIIEVISNMHND